MGACRRQRRSTPRSGRSVVPRSCGAVRRRFPPPFGKVPSARSAPSATPFGRKTRTLVRQLLFPRPWPQRSYLPRTGATRSRAKRHNPAHSGAPRLHGSAPRAHREDRRARLAAHRPRAIRGGGRESSTRWLGVLRNRRGADRFRERSPARGRRRWHATTSVHHRELRNPRNLPARPGERE